MSPLKNTMKKILILTISIFFINLQAKAFEDCIVTTKGKLTDISIEDNTIIDVYPLITVMNDKNTLIVSPLKVGNTKFCVLKNDKEKVMFNVQVSENKTKIDDVKGFSILSIDDPEDEYPFLDEPPFLQEDE